MERTAGSDGLLAVSILGEIYVAWSSLHRMLDQILGTNTTLGFVSNL
jgi:hypothetical protein